MTEKTNGTPKLLKPARQVLRTLARAKGPITRQEIARRVEQQDKLVNHRIANETITYRSLVEWGFIAVVETEVEEGIHEIGYEITARGRKAFGQANEARAKAEAEKAATR
jgi:hypothetical protein